MPILLKHAVVADLPNVEEWQQQIHRRQLELNAVHLRRDGLAAQREKATAALRQAIAASAAARAELSQVESESGSSIDNAIGSGRNSARSMQRSGCQSAAADSPEAA